MACKTCENRLNELVRLETNRNQEKRRADELQRMLAEEREKPSAQELLRTASEAAQIVVLLEKGLPVGAPATDEAAAVAVAALKQVRERLEGEAVDALLARQAKDWPGFGPPHPKGELYDIIVDPHYVDEEEGEEYQWSGPDHSFRVYRTLQAALADPRAGSGKSIYMAYGLSGEGAADA